MADTQSNSNTAPSAVEGEASKKNEESEEIKGADWKFIPPQPMREDQIQNAVNFLSHPKVRGTPVADRRGFLVKKGLTREEIDEAFRRVPDPPAGTTVAQSVPAAAVSPPASVPQSTPVAPASTVTQPSSPPAGAPVALVPQANRGVRWTQLVLAVGLLSAAGAGAAVATKNYFYPKMKAWLRRIVLEEEHQEYKKPDAFKESAATNAVSEIAALARELISSRNEERRYFEGVIKSLEAQTMEIKLSLDSMKESLLNLQTSNTITNPPDQYRGSSEAQKVRDLKFAGGAYDQLGRSVRSAAPSTAPPAPASTNAPHSPSYMEILAMVERGEVPPGIREINDKPPNASQAPSSSVLQPKVKPWERNAKQHVNGTQDSSDYWRKDASKQVDSPKIVEIEEQETSSNGLYSGFGENGSSSRAWVPPPVPKTILPGVDAAIRHKPSGSSGSADMSYDVPLISSDGKSENSDVAVNSNGNKADVPEAEEVTKVATSEEAQ